MVRMAITPPPTGGVCIRIMKTLLRDRAGATIGYVITESNGTKQVFNKSGKRLGKYIPSTNTTVNEIGATVGYGDFSSALATEDANT